jgi:hypothetical protein
MTETRLSLPVAAAVFAGAVILVGVPAAVLTLMLFGELLVVFGVADTLEATGVSAAVTLPLLLVAVLVGLQVAYETTALRFHGLGALHRGSRLTVLARHGLLSLCVLAVLAGVTRFGLSAVLGAERRLATALGAMLVLTVLAVVLWSAQAFADSYRGEPETR